MLPPVLKLIFIIALVQDPIFHKLMVQHIPDHVRCVGPEVPHDVIPEKDIIYQGSKDVFALIGHAPRLVHGQSLRHDPVKLPAIVPDVIERFAVIIFRVFVRE